VRLGHIALFLIASREKPALRHSVAGLAISTALAIGLLVGASFLDGWAQASLWGVAILIDWGGPGLFGTEGWQLVPGHFAERHGLVIILALGESIIALGVGAELDLTAGAVIAYETAIYDNDTRFRLRHGFEVPIPGRPIGAERQT
jgi:low temperature requirement protein LtrA